MEVEEEFEMAPEPPEPTPPVHNWGGAGHVLNPDDETVGPAQPMEPDHNSDSG